jgi:methylated-DNA-[protein]-cysteine S-methyltransferase
MSAPAITTLFSTVTDSPVGALRVVASDTGIRAILWPGDDPARVRLVASIEDRSHPMIAATVVQLAEYFAGDRIEFDVPLDAVGTDFQRLAWAALRTIAYGTTVSYGEQAERMGDRRKARAVGAANGRNPISIIVPCHRVIGANGTLTGFAGGTDTKAWLLEHEQRHLGSGTV